MTEYPATYFRIGDRVYVSSRGMGTHGLGWGRVIGVTYKAVETPAEALVCPDHTTRVVYTVVFEPDPDPFADELSEPKVKAFDSGRLYASEIAWIDAQAQVLAERKRQITETGF